MTNLDIEIKPPLFNLRLTLLHGLAIYLFSLSVWCLVKQFKIDIHIFKFYLPNAHQHFQENLNFFYSSCIGAFIGLIASLSLTYRKKNHLVSPFLAMFIFFLAFIIDLKLSGHLSEIFLYPGDLFSSRHYEGIAQLMILLPITLLILYSTPAKKYIYERTS